MLIIIFIVNENQIENINTQNDEKNNENINMKLLRTIIGIFN